MKKKQKTVQFTLVTIGMLLFVLTYLYYPSLDKVKTPEKQTAINDLEESLKGEQFTSFEQLEYEGLYDFDKQFKVKSGKAFIMNDEPDIVHMTNMHVFLYLSDNRIVQITSDKGRYNKANYNCYFEQNVVATDGETTINSQNLDLLATKNYAEVYNDVELKHETGGLAADKIDYNFETKLFKISMFDNKPIKMKLIQ
tara:strand:+ start:1008 stop:1598 length:591 start_codon:yes stop_codon:yes gene_type:complete